MMIYYNIVIVYFNYLNFELSFWILKGKMIENKFISVKLSENAIFSKF